MVFYDMQEFGGLEEYAVTLAIALKQESHLSVSVLSTAWVAPDNQYLLRLQAAGIELIRPPKWVSDAASDWETKLRLLHWLMWLLTPLVIVLGGTTAVLRRKSLHASITSAHNWLKGKLLDHLIGPDRREAIARPLLTWWRLRWRPDVLHIQGYTTNLLFVVEWADRNGVPTVYEEHQTPDPQFDWWQGFQHTINQAQVVVAVSDRSAQGLRTVCGVTQPIVVRAPLLVDPQAAGWRRTRQRTDAAQPVNLTTVARLSVAKGLPTLLETIAQVQATHPQARFRVYGDGDMRQELLAKAASLGLDGEQIFVGAFTHRDELANIMAETDIFVMSSLLEGQPLSVIEAMAYGCPIVSTAVGGIPEVIQDGVNGLLCAAKNPTCLAEKIRLLIEDAALSTSLATAARRAYERGPYQPGALARFMTNVYQSAVEDAARPMHYAGEAQSA